MLFLFFFGFPFLQAVEMKAVKKTFFKNVTAVTQRACMSNTLFEFDSRGFLLRLLTE